MFRAVDDNGDNRHFANAGVLLLLGGLLVVFVAGKYLLPLSKLQVHGQANAFWMLI